MGKTVQRKCRKHLFRECRKKQKKKQSKSKPKKKKTNSSEEAEPCKCGPFTSSELIAIRVENEENLMRCNIYDVANRRRPSKDHCAIPKKPSTMNNPQFKRTKCTKHKVLRDTHIAWIANGGQWPMIGKCLVHQCAAQRAGRTGKKNKDLDRKCLISQHMWWKSASWNRANEDCTKIIRKHQSKHQGIRGKWTVDKVKECDATIIHSCKGAAVGKPCFIIYANKRSTVLKLRLQ